MRDITKSFPGVKALDGVNLKVEKGTVHALMGENGAGKSTLMKILFGQQPPDSGTILFNGQEVHFKSVKEAVNAGRKLYEAGKRTLDIPIQFSELMRMITKGRIKLNLEIMDSSVPLKTINHMVNKLVVGIVSCGLLMASSLICTTDMTPKVLGIPAIGFIGYMTAVFLGMWLLYTVLKDKRR